MKLTIRTKILIGFALLLLLSSIVQAFTFGITRQYISTQINDSQQAEAQQGAKEIQDFFAELNKNTYGLAKLYGRTDPTAPGSSDRIADQAHYLISNNDYINKITVLSPKGREIVEFDTDNKIKTNLDYEIPSDPFNGAVAGVTTISKVYYIENQTGPFIDIFSPIFGNSGKVSGIIKMQIRLEKLSNDIARVQGEGNGYLYIVDNEGRLIAHKSHTFVLKRPNLSSRKIINDAYLNNKSNLAGTRYINENGVEVAASAVKVPGYNWVVVFEQPVSEAFGFLTLIRNIFMSTLVGSTLFLLLLALFLSENLTRSIRRLQESTQMIERGKFDASILIRSGDEIENLSYAFASMVNQLLQRENSLKKDKQETEVLIQSLTDGVVALDNNNTIIMFNKTAERITGLTADAVYGKNVDMVLHFYEDRTLVPFSSYSSQSEEYVHRLRDKGLTMSNDKGERITVSIATAPILYNDKKTGYIIAFHDTSKEHELEEMKLDFVSMAAHELRTPLTAIRGYASLLQIESTKDLSEAGKQMISRLVASSENLGNLIDNLLSVSRIERNTFAVDAKPADLTGTIKSVIDNIRQQAETKKQKLTLTMPNELPIVMADAFRIGQVLLNLVANAVNYNPEGGQIDVVAEKKDGYLQVTVADKGHGIPKEALSRLFTKFFRVSGALEQGSKGTGLGLYISKSIIEMHHGKIWVESEEEKGAKFTFVLPIATPNEIKNFQENKEKANLTVKNGQGIIIRKKP